MTATKSISSNGTYTVWFKNSNNEISAKTVTVSNIDTAAPTISTGFAVSNISETGATLSVGIKDTASGLDKIVWHYKAEDAEEYTNETEDYSGETAATTKTFALDGLEAGKTYKAYATIYDRAGNTKDTSIITFLADENGDDITTGGDEDEPSNSNNNSSNNTNNNTNNNNTPKPVNQTASATIKNPETSDINLPAIAGIGTVLSAAAFFIFRAKRR